MMPVRLHLFANLAEYLPAAARGEGVAVEVPEGATLDDLAHRLGIPSHLPRLALVNGRESGPEGLLRAGDEVSLLPPLVGGGP
jgi:molybdopterin converting factor small subunit